MRLALPCLMINNALQPYCGVRDGIGDDVYPSCRGLSRFSVVEGLQLTMLLSSSEKIFDPKNIQRCRKVPFLDHPNYYYKYDPT